MHQTKVASISFRRSGFFRFATPVLWILGCQAPHDTLPTAKAESTVPGAASAAPQPSSSDNKDEKDLQVDYGHCAAILERGVYDNVTFSSKYRLDLAERDNWCTTYTKYKEERGSGGGAANLIGILTLGGRYEESSFESVFNVSCRDWSLNRQEQEEVYRFVATINPNVVDAWRSCVNMADQRLEAGVKSANDRSATFTAAQLRPERGVKAEVMLQGVECRGTLGPDKPSTNPISYAKDLTKDSRLTMDCTRPINAAGSAPYARVTISFNTYGGQPFVHDFPTNASLRDIVVTRLDALERTTGEQAAQQTKLANDQKKAGEHVGAVEGRVTAVESNKLGNGEIVQIKNPRFNQCQDRRDQNDGPGDVNVVQASGCTGTDWQKWQLNK